MKKYNSVNFLVKIDQQKDRVVLTQQITNSSFNTRLLPDTFLILSSKIPTIFKNICFNDKKLPFIKEIENTEVGHLFEHLIIENLKIELMKKSKKICFEGVTSWDWSKDSPGTFKIIISSPSIYKKHFYKAFLKSVMILEEIYKNKSFSQHKTENKSPSCD